MAAVEGASSEVNPSFSDQKWRMLDKAKTALNGGLDDAQKAELAFHELPEEGEDVVYRIQTLGGACSPHGHRRLDPESVNGICKDFGLEVFQVQRCFEAFCRVDKTHTGCLNEEEIFHVLKYFCEDMLGQDSQRDLIMAYKGEGAENLTVDFKQFLDIFSHVIAGSGENKWDDVCAGLRLMLDKEDQEQRQEDAPLEVPDIVIAKWMQKELDEADACLQLPTAIILFSVYCAAVLSHEKIGILRGIDGGISFDIVENANFAFSGDVPIENGRMGFKNVFDVNSIPDFWSWISMGLVPLVWPEAWDVSEPRANVLAACTKPVDALNNWTTIWPIDGYGASPSLLTLKPFLDDETCPEDSPNGMPERFFGSANNTRGGQNNMYLYFNRVVGGVRLRQERSEEQECAVTDELQSQIYNGTGCYGGAYWLSPDYTETFNVDIDLTDHPDAPTHVLRTGLPQYDIRSQLKRLEEAIWFTPATQRVEVTLMTYNANADALTVTYINFYFTHAGQIWKRVEPMSIWLTPYSNWYNYVLDIVWVLMLLRVFFEEGWEALKTLCRLGCRKGFGEYCGFWNGVDWLSVLYGFVIMVMWLVHLTRVSNMVGILKSGSLNTPGTWETDSEILDNFLEADSLVKFSVAIRRVLTLYPFVVVLRMFKSFDAQKRMSLVTSTIKLSVTDVAHFAVVFFSIFVAYAISGMILFGQELEKFASFWRSVNTCWRLLLGSFEWDDLRDVSRVEAALWFWTFTILVLLVMLNMFIALVMETYMQVKSGINDDECETLVSQSVEIKNRIMQARKGKILPLEKILEELGCEDTSDEDKQRILNVESFRELVPGLPEEQAIDILTAGAKLQEGSVDGETSLTQALLHVLVMFNRQEGIQCGIEQLGKICLTISQLVKDVNADQRPTVRPSTRPFGASEANAGPAAPAMDEAEATALLNRMAEAAASSAEDQLRTLLHRHKSLLERANTLQRSLQEQLLSVEARLAEADVRLEEERRRRAKDTDSVQRLPNGETMCPGCSDVEVATRATPVARQIPATGSAQQRSPEGSQPAALRPQAGP